MPLQNTLAFWKNSSGSNSLRESFASCEGLLPIHTSFSKSILHCSFLWDKDDDQQHRLTAPPSCVTACVTVSIQPIHLLLLLTSNYWQCLQCWQCWNYWIGLEPIKSNPTDPPLAFLLHLLLRSNCWLLWPPPPGGARWCQKNWWKQICLRLSHPPPPPPSLDRIIDQRCPPNQALSLHIWSKCALTNRTVLLVDAILSEIS